MKQQITQKQVFEVSPDNWLKWAQWHFDKGYKNALPTIGQMIEFLDENDPLGKGFDSVKGTNGLDMFWVVTQYDKVYKKTELCDALWEAVKEILEQ